MTSAASRPGNGTANALHAGADDSGSTAAGGASVGATGAGRGITSTATGAGVWRSGGGGSAGGGLKAAGAGLATGAAGRGATAVGEGRGADGLGAAWTGRGRGGGGGVYTVPGAGSGGVAMADAAGSAGTTGSGAGSGAGAGRDVAASISGGATALIMSISRPRFGRTMGSPGTGSVCPVAVDPPGPVPDGSWALADVAPLSSSKAAIAVRADVMAPPKSPAERILRPIRRPCQAARPAIDRNTLSMTLDMARIAM